MYRTLVSTPIGAPDRKAYWNATPFWPAGIHCQRHGDLVFPPASGEGVDEVMEARVVGIPQRFATGPAGIFHYSLHEFERPASQVIIDILPHPKIWGMDDRGSPYFRANRKP